MKKWCKATMNSNDEAFGELDDKHSDVAYYTPTHYSHEDLLEMAGRMKELTQSVQANLKVLMRAHSECLADRREYKAVCPELIRLTWQSLCTTILSRKVRVV